MSRFYLDEFQMQCIIQRSSGQTTEENEMNLNPRIYCADGVSLSVQANKFAYCSPRRSEGPYHEVEVGFIEDNAGSPLTPPDSWRDYADGEFPSNVYGYVPVDLVAEFIESHGGAVEQPLTENKLLLE